MKKLLFLRLTFLIIFSGVVYSAEFDSNEREIGMSFYTFNPEHLDSLYKQRIETTEQKYNINFNLNYIDFFEFRQRVVDEIKSKNPEYNLLQFDFSMLNLLIEEQVIFPLDTFLPSDYFENLPDSYQIFKDIATREGMIYSEIMI